MASLENGEYIIKFYDRKGGIKRDYTDRSFGLITSVKIGDEVIKDDKNDCVSFTVDRRIYDSLDVNQKIKGN